MKTSVEGLLVISEVRPEWQKKAACRAMLKAFTEADEEEQLAVCSGDTSPWAEPCPVIAECLDAFVKHCLTVGGNQEAYDNVLVHGGLTPWELLKVVQVAGKYRRGGVQATKP